MSIQETTRYKEVYLNRIEDVEKLFFQQNYDEKIGRFRNLYLYRGLPDKNFSLITSLQRVCKTQKRDIELSILNNFAKYAELEEPTIKESIWRKMIIGQHHGIPTRLLDWTKSPLVALHFATSETNMDLMDQRDCAIWRMDVDELNKALPHAYKKAIADYNQKIFTVDMLSDIFISEGSTDKKSLEQYDDDMGNDKMIILEPPSIDPRIVNQYSFFSVVPSDVNYVEEVLARLDNCAVKYVINKHLKWQIRDMLDQVNINERVIYPGLDGIAAWLGRHYFVRNINRFEIVKDDITNLDVDAIVNPSGHKMIPGTTSKKILAAAGNELNKAMHEIGFSNADCFVTDGFNLKNRKIIHAISPVNDGEGCEKLSKIYESILELARVKGIRSIAFPLLGTGYNGFQTDEAWKTAISVCRKYQEENKKYNMDIKFAVMEQEVYECGQTVMKSLIDNEKNKLN